MKKRKRFILFFISCLFLFCVVPNIVSYGAGKDKKKPTITISTNIQEPTNKIVKLTVTVKDASGIQSAKYASGKRTAAYFKKYGKEMDWTKSRTFQIRKNNTYTFYAMDTVGNTTTKIVTIDNIDTTIPELTIKKSTTAYTAKGVTITLTAKDEESGIASISYLDGRKDLDDFNGSELPVKIVSGTKNGIGTVKLTKNGYYTFVATDKAGNQTLQHCLIENIDTQVPELAADYSVKEQKATVKVQASDDLSGVKEIKYTKGRLTDTAAKEWNSATVLSGTEFSVKSPGNYTIMVSDKAGNKVVKTIQIDMEFRAMWISYIEFAPDFNYISYSYNAFKKKIDAMYDDCVEMNMNAVIVQVRPFSDSFYPSQYFPWSGYISGQQGKNPGYDPLAYMVEAAHQRGLEFHAWLNPYRIANSKSFFNTKVSDKNPAKVWLKDEEPLNDRNVLYFDKRYYFNPSSKEVQKLIVDGVKEIVMNYDVDGIHFDDYFYPTLGSNYKKVFDAKEYNMYVDACSLTNTKPLSIVEWRRENVNTLVRGVYSAIKKIRPDVVFGISPAGNISNLMSSQQYYIDIKKWLSSDGYVDYICPQIYWGFEHPTCPYDGTTEKWIDIKTNPNINLYIGLAVHYAGTDITSEWKNNSDILARQIQYGRNTGNVDGYFFFRYDLFHTKAPQKEIEHVLELFQ